MTEEDRISIIAIAKQINFFFMQRIFLSIPVREF